MDRDQIQRRDFPTGRRGYDVAAVDEHLRRIADAFEANTQAPTLSGATSEQVRQILEAAERSVADVQARANEEASDHVARVQAATEGMFVKLDELEAELGRLLTALRTSGERLTQGLAELHAEVSRGATPGANVPPAPAQAAPAETAFPTAAPAPLAGADEAGARLIALNMALGGSSREETARYLAEHFELSEVEALLDDVYARVGR